MTPVRLAPRIVTHGIDSPPPPDDDMLALPVLTVTEDETAVFGDGSHPTTRLCAATLDTVLRQRKISAMLDVGTGTGVLARIARARGVPCVMATDIDPRARARAIAHAQLDLATLPMIHVGDELPDHWGARFDLTVANILERPLLELAPVMLRSLTPGGVVLISGFTRAQVPALRLRYETAGGRFIAAAYLEEWVLLMFERAQSPGMFLAPG